MDGEYISMMTYYNNIHSVHVHALHPLYKPIEVSSVVIEIKKIYIYIYIIYIYFLSKFIY